MNRVGIMIDVSHITDDSFYQVMEISQAPVIASHSSCRTFTPGFIRNMDDEMLKKLAVNGGVIQINFGYSFLDGEIQKKIRSRFITIVEMPAFIQLKINRNLIDIYFYEKIQNNQIFIQKDKSFYPCSLILPTKTIIYNANIYNIPQNTAHVLEYQYGKKWVQKIPKSQYTTILVNGKPTVIYS